MTPSNWYDCTATDATEKPITKIENIDTITAILKPIAIIISRIFFNVNPFFVQILLTLKPPEMRGKTRVFII